MSSIEYCIREGTSWHTGVVRMPADLQTMGVDMDTYGDSFNASQSLKT
jgi:hypothetical protein